jgi:hypothetical protein
MNKNDSTIKQKRGRKSKKELEELLLQNNIKNEVNNNIALIKELVIENDSNDATDDFDSTENLQKPIGKKRGRKPKGGKIIQQIVNLNNNKEQKPNIILHLKCSLKDLQTNTFLSNIESYNFPVCKGNLSYETVNSSETELVQNSYMNVSNKNNEEEVILYDNESNNDNKNSEIKEIWKKLKQLEYNLHINNISDKKSACFWCTYEFDNPPIYIPKYYIKNSYHVYGCFCTPECSVAYLMEENIDSSIKFERYQLSNNIYSQIYNYTKNIKPAPNPYYILDRYYGNLNINEYRSLLRNDKLFLIVDKPLTRILPELHEDNDDFIITNKIIPSNTYQIKKKIQQKKQNQNNIFAL